MNNGYTMKRQPCASNLSPSKLCRLLLLALALKLGVFGFMLWEPFVSGPRQALSAEGAGAPPALPAAAATGEGLPDSALNAVPPKEADIGGAPAPTPGVSGPSDTENRGLPPLPGKSGSGAPAAAGGARPSAVSQTTDITRETLLLKQEELSRKEQQLRTLEAEINGKLERMKLLENRLRLMIKDAEETKDAKFRHLVDVLSNMKSKQAAAVLETLDQKIAVRVLAGMRGRQAGEILTFVNPEKAAHLAEALARMQLPLE